MCVCVLRKGGHSGIKAGRAVFSTCKRYRGRRSPHIDLQVEDFMVQWGTCCIAFRGKKKVNQKYDRGQHMPRCQWPESAASSAHDGIMLHPLVQQRPVSLFTNPGGHTANLPLLLSWHLCSSVSCLSNVYPKSLFKQTVENPSWCVFLELFFGCRYLTGEPMGAVMWQHVSFCHSCSGVGICSSLSMPSSLGFQKSCETDDRVLQLETGFENGPKPILKQTFSNYSKPSCSYCNI